MPPSRNAILGLWLFFTLLLPFVTLWGWKNPTLHELFFDTYIIVLLWLAYLAVTVFAVVTFAWGTGFLQKLWFAYTHADELEKQEDEIRKRKYFKT